MENLFYKQFAKNIGIIGLTNAIISLKGIILLPFLTKYLGIYDYGVWAQIMVTVSLFTPIVTLGLPFSLVRFLAGEKNKKEIREGIYSVLFLIFAIGLIISLFLIIFSRPVSSFLGSEYDLIIILAFLVLFECLNSVFLNVLRAFQEIKKYSFFIIFQNFGGIGLVAIAIILNYGLLGAVFSLLIINLIIFLILGGMIIKGAGFELPNFSRIKQYLSFGVPTIPGNLGFWVVQSSDRYLIGYFLGITSVGYYAAGYTLGNILMLFLTPLSFLLTPVLSKLYDENKINEVKICLSYSLKYFLMVAIPSVFGLSVLARQLLTILSTTEIASQGHLITILITISILFFGGRVVTSQILALVKKTNISSTIWISAAIVNFGLNFIFIPHFGILGAAITTLIAFTLAFSLTLFYSSRYFTFSIDRRFILKSVFASTIMSLIIIRLNATSIIELIIAIIIGILIYAITLFILKGVNKEEIKFFGELFKIRNSRTIQ